MKTIEERIDEIRNATEPESIKPEELADILDLLNKSNKEYMCLGEDETQGILLISNDPSQYPKASPPQGCQNPRVAYSAYKDKYRCGCDVTMIEAMSNPSARTRDIYVNIGGLGLSVTGRTKSIQATVAPCRPNTGNDSGEHFFSQNRVNYISVPVVWYPSNDYIVIRMTMQDAMNGVPFVSVSLSWTHSIYDDYTQE